MGTLLKVLARNGFDVDLQCLNRLFYLLVLGVFNSVYGTWETIVNSRAIRNTTIDEPPLFIIGHWRSGTTHLHNLLSLDENLAYCSAFQALFPHHFLSSSAAGILLKLFGPSKRPMDNVAFGSHVPHEDEFALVATSAVSPYLKVFFPVDCREEYACLDPQRLPSRAREEWQESLILLLKKLTLLHGKRIVLKSPPHLGRVGTLLEMFPDAQFVHIVRDPYTVYVSTKKLWKDAMSSSHLQVPEPEVIDELILSWYTELFALFERDRDLIPRGALHEMRFEDLEERPLESLRSLYDALDLPGFEPMAKRVSEYLESIRGYKKNAYELDAATYEKVARHWRTTFEQYGYPM